jgi:outer membrane protein assembly factor BamD
MTERLGKFICVLLILSAFGSCSHFNKLVKSTDLEKKYYEAKKYYESGDCVKAATLLEELVTVYRSASKAESIYYYYAYANYCTQDYILAAYHFKNFARNFPNSGHAEECQFMSAYCYSLESPRYSLDQSDTKSAIKEMQIFINKYPASTLVDSCNHVIDRLRAKLEKKTFEIAKQYYDIEDYKGSELAFENMLKDYPDTKFREEALFWHLKASYLYATHSVENKKSERFDQAIDFYTKFVSAFPQGKYLREAESIYNSSVKQKQKLSLPNKNS